MNIKYKIKNLRTKLKENFQFKTYLFSLFSIFITIIFAIYNIYLGIIYNTGWNISIAIYYGFLIIIRTYILYNENKLSRLNISEYKIDMQKKLYLKQCIMLFTIDLLLIAPISIMVLGQKEVNYSTIPAIATAAYTTCKMILATKNALQAKKNNNLSIIMLRNINLKDSLVAILSLQYILIMTFESETDNNMLIVSCISTFCIWILLIIISIKTICKAIQINKTK